MPISCCIYKHFLQGCYGEPFTLVYHNKNCLLINTVSSFNKSGPDSGYEKKTNVTTWFIKQLIAFATIRLLHAKPSLRPTTTTLNPYLPRWPRKRILYAVGLTLISKTLNKQRGRNEQNHALTRFKKTCDKINDTLKSAAVS